MNLITNFINTIVNLVANIFTQLDGTMNHILVTFFKVAGDAASIGIRLCFLLLLWKIANEGLLQDILSSLSN